YDEAAGKSCLDALSAALAGDCSYASIQFNIQGLNADACAHVVSGDVPTGGTCTSGAECVAGDTCSYQFTGQMCLATCRPSDPALMPGDTGAPCSNSSGTCKTGLACVPSADYKTGTCGAPPGAGAACFGSTFDSRRGCAAGLICDVNANMPTCVPEKQQ